MRGEDFIERRIATGLIVSTEYARRVAPFWDDDYIGSPEVRRIARWCLNYLEKYDRAPGRDIQSLYYAALRTDEMPKDEAELVHLLLERISAEFERSDGDAFNVPYLFDQTIDHVRDRELRLHNMEVEDLRERGRLAEAEALGTAFTPLSIGSTRGLEVGSEEGYARVEQAFADAARPLIRYPGALGEMMSSALVRDGFVAFLAPEKRGKCLSGDQRVLTTTGETIRIVDLIASGRRDVIAYDERSGRFIPSTVSHFHVNGLKKVWTLTTRTGRSVRVTANHPFLTPDGWVELEGLSVGDYVAVPRSIPVFGSESLTAEQVRLMAYVIADGCLGNATNEIVGFTKADPDIQDDFRFCVESMGCAVRRDGIGAMVVNSPANRYKHGRNFVRTFLREHGLTRKRSYEKVIPQSVYRLRREDLAAFLSVLITCDGWVNRLDACDLGVGFAVANEILARQVQELLSRFGIVSGLRFKPNDKRGAWTVSIGDYENVLRFRDEIGLRFSKGRVLDEVLSVREVSSRSFLDKFPPGIAARFYAELEDEFGVSGSRRDRHSSSWCAFAKRFTRAGAVRGQVVRGLPLMRQTFDEVRDTVTGRKYMDAQVLWDEVVGIDYVGVEDTYDLTVDDCHNFVAENVLVHNTFTMIDLGFRALRQKSNVAFFQAGDLTEGQALRRFAIYLTRRNSDPRYCLPYWRPVGDCELNQHDRCDRADRNCDHGVYEEDEYDGYLEDPTAFQNMKALSEVARQFDTYRPCDASGCDKRRPCAWLVREKEKEPLTGPSASRAVRKFFEQYRRRFRLGTYPNDTLSVAEISSCLDEWERQSGFVPDVIIVDYADLMVAPDVREYRHRQDAIWKGLRGLSQKRHALVVTATQADADSYRSSLLKLSNFSEDKRKYGHVTAMWGLNQDPSGREKELGLMRINEMVVRDGATVDVVTVLQDLRAGRAFIESYSSSQAQSHFFVE